LQQSSGKQRDRLFLYESYYLKIPNQDSLIGSMLS